MNMGVIVSRETHKRHHANGMTNYGVFISPLNTFYDTIHIWSGMEHVLKIFGVQACKKRGVQQYPDFNNKDTYDDECPPPVTGEDVKEYLKRLHQLYETLPLCRNDEHNR
tara:strand:+ start:225 stop:554 length:330 start_codon:yes stop_codon:yes gene_type:complete